MFQIGPLNHTGRSKVRLRICSPLIADTNANIQISDLPQVRAYDVHLVQLFQNLIGNALKYRGAASPVIHVSANWDATRNMWLFSDS